MVYSYWDLPRKPHRVGHGQVFTIESDPEKTRERRTHAPGRAAATGQLLKEALDNASVVGIVGAEPIDCRTAHRR
jgi:hypothetical protein